MIILVQNVVVRRLTSEDTLEPSRGRPAYLGSDAQNHADD